VLSNGILILWGAINRAIVRAASQVSKAADSLLSLLPHTDYRMADEEQEVA
jgi:antirestriction protein ArdC